MHGGVITMDMLMGAPGEGSQVHVATCQASQTHAEPKQMDLNTEKICKKLEEKRQF